MLQARPGLAQRGFPRQRHPPPAPPGDSRTPSSSRMRQTPARAQKHPAVLPPPGSRNIPAALGLPPTRLAVHRHRHEGNLHASAGGGPFADGAPAALAGRLARARCQNRNTARRGSRTRLAAQRQTARVRARSIPARSCPVQREQAAALGFAIQPQQHDQRSFRQLIHIAKGRAFANHHPRQDRYQGIANEEITDDRSVVPRQPFG